MAKNDKKTVLVSFRIPPEVKWSFDRACAYNDQTASQVFRALARQYIAQTANAALLRQTAAMQKVDE